MPEQTSTQEDIPHTVREVLLEATATLMDAAVPSPRLDAEVLLAHVLNCRRAQLYVRPEQVLTQAQRQELAAAVERRRQHEPVPYITGHREFFRLDFVVDRRVLIPRPETELLVERALQAARQAVWETPALSIADAGTGSGIVAVSLAVNLPQATVYALDSSLEALQVAARNIARHRVLDQVRLLPGELLEPLPEPVHIIAANLPYVPTKVLPSLDRDVVDYEPLLALDGGPDGLLYIRQLLREAPSWLVAHGVVVLEIGAGQGQEVVALASARFPGARVELFEDYARLDRIVRIWT
jgi:release factor glutamine methyltransferase